MFRFMSHHRPALGSGFVECLVQFPDMRCAIVRPFTLSVGMMNQAHESRPGSRSRPLQHLVIAVGIAEGKNGTTADELLDPDRFALLVASSTPFPIAVVACNDRSPAQHFQIFFDETKNCF